MIFRFFLLFLLLFGCSINQSEKRILSINILQEPPSIDPRFCNDLVFNQIYYVLYRNLFKINEKGQIKKDLISQYCLSSDQKKYTFKLKKAHWSDGSVITAQDIEMSWKKTLDPIFPSKHAYLFYSIKNAKQAKEGKCSLNDVGIQALDKKTLQVTLKQADSLFLKKITASIFLPVKDSLFSGPYQVKEWKLKDHMTLEKNPFYTKNRGFDKIRIFFISSQSSALDLFLDKKLDIIGFPFTPAPLAASHFLDRNFPSKTTSVYGTKILSLNYNRAFKNAHLRKAFLYSIPKSEILKQITYQGETLANTLIPKKSTEDLYNPQKALSYLQNIALPKKLTLLYSNDEINCLIAQSLKNNWESILHIQIELQSCELTLLRDRLNQKDYDIALISWISEYPSSENFLNRLSHKDHFQNTSGWESSKYQLHLQNTKYSQAEKILSDEIPIIPLYHWSYKIYFQSHLKNIQASPMGTVFLESITSIKHPSPSPVDPKKPDF